MRKSDQKQKQSIYISKKIEFKKESQTIQTVIKDKEIESKKKVIINLLKMHSNISDELSNTKQLYKKQKNVYQKKHCELVNEFQHVNACVLKIKVRKHRLEALEDQRVTHYFGDQLKKYLRTWVEVNRHYLAQKLGGIENLKIATKISWKFETLYYVKPQHRKITYLKLIRVINENCRLQSAIFCVKKHSLNQNEEQIVNIEIYATSGKYFYISRLIKKEQLNRKISFENPIQNLLIFTKRKQIVFLDQYFLDMANVQKIQRVLKICKFQMDVLRQKKKLVLYKKLKISNIFESVYQMQGYKQLKLDILLSIKRKQIIKESENEIPVYANGNNRRMNRYGKDKANKEMQEKDRVQIVYVLRCETIVQEDKKYAFCIQDENIMKYYEHSIENFVSIFENKYLIYLTAPCEEGQENKQINQYNHNGGSQPTLQRLTCAKIVRVIDFEQQKNLKKIIKAQSFIKMSIWRKKYRENRNNCKKLRTFDFCCQIESNIIISAYIKGEEVRFFVECLSLSSERKRQVSQDLRYPKKYWPLVEEFMVSDEMIRIRNKYLIWEVEEQISACFQQVIQKYQQHQIRINEMKPLKAINRLKRFFIKSYLKHKRKTNILYIKKIEKEFGSQVLIIRKSVFLKNLAEAYLYPLIKDQKKENRSNYITKILGDENNKENRIKGRISCQSRVQICEQKNCRYKEICFYIEDAKNFIKYFKDLENFNNLKSKNEKITYQKSVESQFYITENYFLLKPRHLEYISGQYKFIQRLGSINLNSQQILSQLQSYTIQKNLQNSHPQQLQKRTILKQRSMLKLKKLTSTIVFEQAPPQSNLRQNRQNEKTSPNIQQGNAVSNVNFNLVSKQSSNMLSCEKNVIFFTFFKNAEDIFCLELYLVVRAGQHQGHNQNKKIVNYCKFQRVHQQEVSKKDVLNLGLNIVYKIIAIWIHKNDKNYHFEEMIFAKSWREIGNSSPGGSNTLNENNSGLTSNGGDYISGRDRITQTDKSFKGKSQQNDEN